MGQRDARIRKRLRDAKPNQKDLARALNKSQAWVSKYLNNGNSTADIDDLAAIAAYLNVSLADLIDGDEPLSAPSGVERHAREIAEMWIAAHPAARRHVQRFLAFETGQTVAIESIQRRSSEEPE